MAIKAGELAKHIGAVCEGNPDVELDGISGVKEATPGDLTFVVQAKYLADLKDSKASAVIAPPQMEVEFPCIIRAPQARLALVKAIELLTPRECPPESMQMGVHPLSFIGKDVKLGEGVCIGPLAIVEDHAEIGSNTLIYSGAYVGRCSKIGKDCKIYPNVTVREEVTIGDRVILHSGTVIGADGFGYTKEEGIHYKIPQRGTVVIEDDVEMGANVTVDRATFGRTWIKKGIKIDNLVHIAHNVIIGENTIIVAQTGIAGSTELGKNVTLAGQVAVTDHVKIGDNAIVTGRSAVSKNIPPGIIVSGHPAIAQKDDQRIRANLSRLPSMAKRLKELEEKVTELTERLERETLER